MKKDAVEFEYILKLQNFGERPAYNVSVELYTIYYNWKEKSFFLIDSLIEKTPNPIAKNVQWDIGNKFSREKYSSNIFIILRVKFEDQILNELMTSTFYYSLPRIMSVISEHEYKLVNVPYNYKKLIDKYLNGMSE